MTIKALVAFAHDKGFCLLYGDDVADKNPVGTFDYQTMREQLEGHGCSGDAFSMEPIDHAPLKEGIYIGELKLVDDGPSDWPGAREVAVSFQDAIPISEKEWGAFCAGDWPWGADE